jgi:hypothetical protein
LLFLYRCDVVAVSLFELATGDTLAALLGFSASTTARSLHEPPHTPCLSGGHRVTMGRSGMRRSRHGAALGSIIGIAEQTPSSLQWPLAVMAATSLSIVLPRSSEGVSSPGRGAVPAPARPPVAGMVSPTQVIEGGVTVGAASR